MAEKLAKERTDIKLDVLDMSDTENYITALQLQIASTPSFVLEDTPICVGYLPSYEELKRKIVEHEKKRG
jgi:protein-disulfide isomerase